MHNWYKNQLGFSLIEILVAVGLLAAMVATLMPAVELSAKFSSDDKQLMSGIFLANNKMIELEQEIDEDIERGKFPDEISRSGNFEEPFADYSWEYTIKKVEIPLAESGQDGQSAVVAGAIKNIMKEVSKSVRELKVIVRWGDPEEEKDVKEYSLTTHVVNIK